MPLGFRPLAELSLLLFQLTNLLEREALADDRYLAGLRGGQPERDAAICGDLRRLDVRKPANSCCLSGRGGLLCVGRLAEDGYRHDQKQRANSHDRPPRACADQAHRFRMSWFYSAVTPVSR